MNYLIPVILAFLPQTSIAMEPQILRHKDTLYARIQLFDTTICYAGKIWEITEHYPKDWEPVAKVLKRYGRPLTQEETIVCSGGLSWKVAPNIYRGKELPDRPASYYGKKGGTRIEVGQPCFEYIADSRGNYQYRIAYLPGGIKVTTICSPHYTVKEIQQ